jgi:indolepyruvate ferredoxin oxidoreductase
VKKEFGAGIQRWFRMLARLKGLRGTPLDIFGYTAERRMERALIKQYEADMARILPKITPATRELALELARLPLDIRGFGPVKHGNAEVAAKRRLALLASFDEGGPQMAQAAE